MSEHDCTCCETDQTQQRRNFAMSLVNQANDLKESDKGPLAAKAMELARMLIEEFGGVTGIEGVWLLTSEAAMPMPKELSLEKFKEALALAEADLEPEHYAIGICLINLGETFLELGDNAEALEVYERAKPLLDAARIANTQSHLTQYLKNAADEAAAGLEKSLQ